MEGGALPGPQFVLPNSEHPPPLAAQGSIDQTIPDTIPGEFFLPKSRILFGKGRVQGAGMPKAAVNEDRYSLLPKNEVRFAEDLLFSAPASNPNFSKHSNQRQLGFQVAARSYAGHHVRSLLRGKDIRTRHRFFRSFTSNIPTLPFRHLQARSDFRNATFPGRVSAPLCLPPHPTTSRITCPSTFVSRLAMPLCSKVSFS